MVIQSSKPIIHYLPSCLCHNVYDIAIITINKKYKIHKPTDKLYITCLLRVQLYVKLHFYEKSKYLQNIVRFALF